MKSIVKAFAPANISCFFKIHTHKNPRLSGSSGLGFTLNKGVIVSVSKAKKTGMSFNKKNISFPTVKGVLDVLTKEKLRVEITSKLPLGCGFGLSGASALATAYAVNKLLNLKKTKKKLAIIVHTEEVRNKTGLGDVVNQYYGGCLVKFRTSADFKVVRLPMSKIPVCWTSFGRLSTKKVLANQTARKLINKAGRRALRAVEILLKSKKTIQFRDIITISRTYALESGLLRHPKTIQTIKAIEDRGGSTSMIMLGNAVFSDTSFKGSKKLTISDKAAHVL